MVLRLATAPASLARIFERMKFGMAMPAITIITATTTNSSIKVKPAARLPLLLLADLFFEVFILRPRCYAACLDPKLRELRREVSLPPRSLIAYPIGVLLAPAPVPEVSTRITPD